jgi:mitochondrial fission protein ELM1
MGHLAWADAFVITADSVSMLSEACSTGYVYSMMMRISLVTVVG